MVLPPLYSSLKFGRFFYLSPLTTTHMYINMKALVKTLVWNTHLCKSEWWLPLASFTSGEVIWKRASAIIYNQVLINIHSTFHQQTWLTSFRERCHTPLVGFAPFRGSTLTSLASWHAMQVPLPPSYLDLLHLSGRSAFRSTAYQTLVTSSLVYVRTRRAVPLII